MTTTTLDDDLGLNATDSLEARRSTGLYRGRVIVALPAYNEAKALEPLLEGIRAAMEIAGLDYTVIVVDDGSRDETALVASQATFSMPVTLVEHEVNQGLAAALRTCFTSALEVSRPGDVIVTMDSDNTHPPGLIARMVDLVREGHDVVIASRYRSARASSACRGIVIC